MEEKKISRRQFIVGGVVAVAAVALGYEAVSHQKMGKDFDEIKGDYPEIGNLPVFANGEIQTKSGVNVKWFNLSKASFDVNRASDIFNYFEQLSNNSIGLGLKIETGEIVNTLGLPRSNADRIFIFIPEDAPSPSWANGNKGDERNAATHIPTLTSFVRIFDSLPEYSKESSVFTTIDRTINVGFYTEACQSVIRWSASDSVPAEFNTAAQEVACNSIASTLAVKSIGLDYSQYNDWTNRVNAEIPLIRFSPQDYGELPALLFPLISGK